MGLLLIIFFAEKLVKATVNTSLNFGLSIFLISVIFIGFDPENLGIGAVATSKEASSIAIGSIIGSAMVAITFALGLTAIISPLKFKKAPRQILIVPVAASILLGVTMLYMQISRVDGLILMIAFVFSVGYLIYLGKQGKSIESSGEVAETLEESEKRLSKWQSFGLLVASIILIIIGSELLVTSAKFLISEFSISETFFGIIILAFLISIEEIARELPAALRGRPEITFGNIIGSVMAFFLFNASIIAFINPIKIDRQVLDFYFPLSLFSILLIALFMLRQKIGRIEGLVLVLIYLVFVFGKM